LLRPVPLLAAGLVVIAAAVFWSSRGPEQSSLRESTPQAQAFALHAAQVAADGSIHLSWSSMMGADQYQVRIYGPDFGEIYRSRTHRDVDHRRERAALPARSTRDPRPDLACLRPFQGDVIATSAPGSIRTR
jgi:hypothetical protein